MAKFKGDKITLKFDIDVLDAFITYVLTFNSLITRGNLSNMRELLTRMDMRIYNNNMALENRINFLQRALDARLDDGMENPTIIINHALGHNVNDKFKQEISTQLTNQTMRGNEIKWINNTIAERLKYVHLYQYREIFNELFERLYMNDFETLKDLNNNFESVIIGLMNEIRKVKARETSDMTFTMAAGEMEEVVEMIVNKLKEPAAILKTGLKMHNEMLGGGYHSGRVYTYLGLPGVGKSTILLSAAKWISRYNTVETQDPLKRPAVLLVTQENDLPETVERLFNMTCTAEDIRNFTPAEVIEMLRRDGQMTLNGDSNSIDIIIKFIPHRAISTADLYTIIDELGDRGIEVVALVHDYLKRIRSIDPNPEVRIEFGNIINEFKTLAQVKNIPVITAMQLNRDGARTVDAGTESNKTDITKMLGRSNVGESWLVIENSDVCVIVNKESKEVTHEDFMVFKRIKCRYRAPEVSYMVHPFEQGNSMKLVDDIHLAKIISLKTLTSNLASESGIEIGKKGRQSAVKRDEYDEFAEQCIGVDVMNSMLAI